MFQDLTPETLKKCKELKEITASLKEANIHHRWASPLKLQVMYKDKTCFIHSKEKGYEILGFLNLSMPMKTDKASVKRKLNIPG